MRTGSQGVKAGDKAVPAMLQPPQPLHLYGLAGPSRASGFDSGAKQTTRACVLGHTQARQASSKRSREQAEEEPGERLRFVATDGVSELHRAVAACSGPYARQGNCCAGFSSCSAKRRGDSRATPAEINGAHCAGSPPTGESTRTGNPVEKRRFAVYC
jgi:hypothetical protein